MDDYSELLNRIAPHPGDAPTVVDILGFRFGEPARQQWVQALALRDFVKQRLAEEQIKQSMDPLRKATLADLSLLGGKPAEEYALPSQIKINKELTPSAVPHFELTNTAPSLRPMSLGYNLVERQEPPTLQPRFTPDELAGLERMAPEEFHKRYGTLDYVDREELLAHMREAKDLVPTPPSTGIEPYLRDTRMRLVERPGDPLEITTRTVDPNTPLAPVQQEIARALLERMRKPTSERPMNQWDMLAASVGLENAGKLFAEKLEAQAKRDIAAADVSKSTVALNEERVRNYIARTGLADAKKREILDTLEDAKRLRASQTALNEMRAKGISSGIDQAQERLNFDKLKFSLTGMYLLSGPEMPSNVRDYLLHEILDVLGVDVSGPITREGFFEAIRNLFGSGVTVKPGSSPLLPGTSTQPQGQQAQPREEGKSKPSDIVKPTKPGTRVGERKLDTETGNMFEWTGTEWVLLPTKK